MRYLNLLLLCHLNSFCGHRLGGDSRASGPVIPLVYFTVSNMCYYIQKCIWCEYKLNMITKNKERWILSSNLSCSINVSPFPNTVMVTSCWWLHISWNHQYKSQSVCFLTWITCEGPLNLAHYQSFWWRFGGIYPMIRIVSMNWASQVTQLCFFLISSGETSRCK